MGRSEATRVALPADREFECADYLWAARGGGAGELDRDGAHRAAAPNDGGLYFEGDGEARSGIVDVAGAGDALRDCDGECGARNYAGAGKLDVERKENSHSRRGAVEDTAVDAVLFAAEGCGPIFGGV